jgi:signal transduction histidine kinase
VETTDSTAWVSTYGGIAWYDGYRWNPVIVDSSLTNQRVRTIEPFGGNYVCVILAGSLYVGGKKGFEKIDFSWISNNVTVVSVAVKDSTTYYSVVELPDTSYVVKNQKGINTILRFPAPGKLYNPKTNIWMLGEGGGGNTNLYIIKNDSAVKINTYGYHLNAIREIVENDNGFGLLAADAPKQDIGLFEYDKNFRITHSSTEKNQPVRTLDISEKSEAVVIYESGEIHIRTNEHWVNIDPLPKQMLNVVSVQYRKNNDLWFCTENGLYLFKRQENIWTKRKTGFSDIENVVMEVFQTKEEDLWVGTMNGVEIQSSVGGSQFVTTINGKALGLVTGINQDKNGHVWIVSGAGFTGAYEWDGNEWIHHRISSADIGFHKIRKDVSGDLWFLGLGIHESDPAGYVLQNGKWLRIDSMYNIMGNRIYSFVESRSGSKWIGTRKGLTRIERGKIKHWGREVLGKNTTVYTLAVDNREKVWFSTFSPQLGTITDGDSIVWVWKDDEVYNYKQKVWDLSFDKVGVLWAATTRGLFRYYNSTWSNYSAEMGMNIRELRVVLPTIDKIYIGGHGIGFRTIQRKYFGAPIKVILSKPIVESHDVHLSWEPLSFWGAVPSEQIETRYKLDGEQWSAWSTSRNLLLGGLGNGNHEFFVQAKDAYGLSHDYNAQVSFYVEPPAYLQPIYAIPFSTLLITVVVMIARYQIAQKNNKILVQNQRTRIANDLHDEVGSNLGSIALISQRLGRDETASERIKEDLSIITETSLQTSEFLRDIVWYINPRYDTFMNLEARLREIAGRMLRDIVVQIEMGENVRQDEKFIESRRNIILMFKEILHNIMKHARSTSVLIRFERKPNSFVLTVKDDGVGFGQGDRESGNGLLSLQRRAEEIGAELKIHSVKGEGTEVIIIFKNNVNTI